MGGANFSWTDEQRARLVPGAKATVHWDDEGPTVETVVGVQSDAAVDLVVGESGAFSISAWLYLVDPESVVSP
jgi:hypothetical protein